LRRLRIVASVQLSLPLPAARTRAEELWATLPEAARTQVLALLARLIARGVLDDEEAAT
jgi:hypothetical protein